MIQGRLHFLKNKRISHDPHVNTVMQSGMVGEQLSITLDAVLSWRFTAT